MHPFRKFMFDVNHKSFQRMVAKGFGVEGVKSLITEHSPECAACGNELFQENAFHKRVFAKDLHMALREDVSNFLRRKGKDWQKVDYRDGQNSPFHYYRMMECPKCGFHNHMLLREFMRSYHCDDLVFITFLQGKDYKKTLGFQVQEIIEARSVKQYNSWWITCKDGVIYADVAEFLQSNKDAKELYLHYYNNDELVTITIPIEKN